VPERPGAGATAYHLQLWDQSIGGVGGALTRMGADPGSHVTRPPAMVTVDGPAKSCDPPWVCNRFLTRSMRSRCSEGEGCGHQLLTPGFEALATTSAGLAWSLGRGDAQVGLHAVLDHLRLVADAVAVPFNADFRDGYAVEPEGVATNVTMAVDTGIAGLSIEDSSGDDAEPLLDSTGRCDAWRPPGSPSTGAGMPRRGAPGPSPGWTALTAERRRPRPRLSCSG
jgi:hypothetical protein